jgi:hypothetical protein
MDYVVITFIAQPTDPLLFIQNFRQYRASVQKLCLEMASKFCQIGLIFLNYYVISGLEFPGICIFASLHVLNRLEFPVARDPPSADCIQSQGVVRRIY